MVSLVSIEEEGMYSHLTGSFIIKCKMISHMGHLPGRYFEYLADSPIEVVRLSHFLIVRGGRKYVVKIMH
jgi:hypothetical protein